MNLKKAFKELVEDGYKTRFSPLGDRVFIYIDFDKFYEIVKDLGAKKVKYEGIEITSKCGAFTSKFIVREDYIFTFYNKRDSYEIVVTGSYGFTVMRITQKDDEIEISNQ